MNNLIDLRQVVTVTHERTNARLAGDGFIPENDSQMPISVALQMAVQCLIDVKHPDDGHFNGLLALEYLQPVVALVKGANHA
jgi:hypothetical protein